MNPAEAGEDSATPPSRLRNAAATIAVATIAALLLRNLLRDRWLLTELLFLAPWPIWAVAGIIGSTIALRHKAIRAIAAAVFLLLGAWALAIDQPGLLRLNRYITSTEPPGDAVRICFWNLMSFNRGTDVVVEELLAVDADVILFVEGTYRGAAPDFLRRALGSEYQWVSTRQMAVGSRLPITRSRQVPCETRLRAFEVEIETPTGPLAIVLADFIAPPRLDTRAMFQELWLVQQTAPQPLLLIGDFNTPTGSWHLQRATEGLHDAFVNHSGWRGTFHDRLPYYAIDHAYHSSEIQLHSARVEPTRASNHHRLVLEITP